MTTTYDPATESLDALTGLGGDRGPKHYFGEIAIVDDFDCVLRKGAGKVPFDPGVHRPEERLVALKIKIVCTKQDGSTYDLDQDDITSGSKHKMTLASLKTLGIVARGQLRELAGQYCQIVRVETGTKYQAKKASADGRVQAGDWLPETAMQFLAIYDDADACKAAEAEFYAPRGEGRNQPQPVTAADTGSAPTIARDALIATLPALVMAAQKNTATLQSILNGNPQYAANGITVASPEVLTLLAA